MSSHRPDNPPYIQGGRVSVKVTLSEFSNAMISANVTASRRTILQLYDWVAANYGTIISPRRFSNGTYTTASSFALDVFKVLKEVNADNSSRSDVREALESYSHMTVPGMDPTAVIDACLHNLALIRSKITALGACAPTSALAEGKELIRDSLRGCLDLMEADRWDSPVYSSTLSAGPPTSSTFLLSIGPTRSRKPSAASGPPTPAA